MFIVRIITGVLVGGVSAAIVVFAVLAMNHSVSKYAAGVAIISIVPGAILGAAITLSSVGAIPGIITGAILGLLAGVVESLFVSLIDSRSEYPALVIGSILGWAFVGLIVALYGRWLSDLKKR